MNMKPITSIIVLFTLISSGCLGIIDDINNDIDNKISFIDGEYPQLDLSERIFGSPELISYDRCDNLLEDLRNSVYDEMIVQLDQQSYYHWSPNPWITWTDDIALAEGTMVADTSQYESSSSDRDGEFSGTNNQESGVDEADFIKTDGNHIYMLNGDKFLIMEVPEFGELDLISNLTMLGSPMQMMLEGDRVVITSNINSWNLDTNHPLLELMGHEESYSYYDSSGIEETYTYTRYESLVMYSVVDISDRNNPVIENELFIEGNYHTARLVDGTVRSVTHLYTYFNGLKTWVDLPNYYYQIEDSEERIEIWNESLMNTITTNTELIESLSLEDFVPQMYQMDSNGNYFATTTYSNDCSEFSASQHTSVRGLTTIMTMKLLGEDVEFEIDHITSRWAHVYSSGNTLLLAEPVADWWWFWRNNDFEDATNIHAFDISDSNTTSYLGSGRVSGTVQDQFSMSEFQGSIRIASTSDSWGRWWLSEVTDENDEPIFTGPSNQVTILHHQLENCLSSPCNSLVQVGIIENIAPNETIWSARFIGERGYLVTFENIDPLWVIDLSDPFNPYILGELEIPGVSTYIHPVNDDYLLTIGIGPGEGGLGLDWSNTQVSLFDVSDPSNPSLTDVMSISPINEDEECNSNGCGWSWSYSEATYEHKAFTYWAPENLLAVPLSTYRYTYDEIEIDGNKLYSYGYEFVSTLELINVDVDNGTLSTHGTVDHTPFYNSEDVLSSRWFGSTSVSRSIFMGDYVYSFSTAGVTVHKTDSLQLTIHLDLPGFNIPDAYYYGEEESALEESEVECEFEYEADPFADSVVSFQPGNGSGFGEEDYPEIVLGPPYGGGENSGSLDVLSLGENGSIILAFEDWIAVDGEGADILIFENPFTDWNEPGIVSASIDGETWFEWPCDATDAANGYPGCAGVSPVISNPDNNCVDATDPELAGGDAYDLADIGLDEAVYIRIVDAGVSGPGGFDLDSVSIVNGRIP